MQTESAPATQSSIPTVRPSGPLPNEPPTPTLPPIAGFWRRLLAWFADIFLLGAAGQVLAISFASFFFSIGPYGRPIGLLFVIPYFGILNSRLGGGQTLGKRLMHIAVRNTENQPIGVGRAVLRILILSLPPMLNGWAIPIFRNPIVTWVALLLVFGLGGAILYTMVFNRNARQGIHDMLLGTYVVHLRGKPLEVFPVTRRIHWIVAGAWMGIVAIGGATMGIITPQQMASPILAETVKVYDTLSGDPRFFSAQVVDNTMHGPSGRTSRTLRITVWSRGTLPADQQRQVIGDIVRTALDRVDNIDEFDGIQVNVTTAYDIGIASASRSSTWIKSVEQWRREIH